MADTVVEAVPDAGLGNASYLVDLGAGGALAVDPCRDLRALRAAAARRGLRITHVAETHLHADFLTGAIQLAATDGAAVLASAAGGREFPHRPLAEGDEVDLGGLTLRAMATPGHTAEHLAYLLADGSRPLGIFTGGSLLAGSAARTDLVGEGRTEELARAQYASLQRLAALPDELVVWPTHGAGTFCAVGAGAAGSATTIGAERSGNRVLGAPDEESFVRLMVDSLGTFPPYFLRLPEQNRRGPAVLPTTLHVPGIAPEAGVLVVDVRPAADFAAGHPEGAISIPLRPAFPTWLAWLAPHDRPLLLLRDEGQDLQEILWLAAKVGYTNILGEVDGGIEAWRRSGLPISTTPLRPAFHSPGVRVLDIRQRSEFDGGHVPGAVNIELGELQDRLVDLPDLPMVVMCGHGERAMGAASILHRAGFTDVTVLDGGPADWLDANPPPGTERP